MELLQGDEFEALFHGFRSTAYHLELKDSYDTPEERGPFDFFLQGKADDYAWHEPWLSLVRSVTQSGRYISRARIVSVPHVDYTRWGLEVAKLNTEAGEDIRYLPRQDAENIVLPPDDFWLFDENRLIFTVFASDGRFLGGAEIRYQTVVEQCLRAWRQVWEIATPYGDYVSG